ncbi:UDP-N-acetylglucosamine--N-acetylmuramyl-(pentapeptide) pyrophosphoryl-undecaprenol N-acetylglucosamine transferase [Spirochaetota bacterium]|nr:UDP-N-acetylglucosamine--N-acetylmuramyl-(pentapeptide) pyrophosphoryl-undecaprenol N-acetylglucosamine transferase [Spirochaetota bacterium]
MKTIILSGGGSGGHVTPLLSVLKEIKFRQYKNKVIEIVYIGRKHGIERSIFEQQVDTYFGIAAGKWRRYFSVKNLLTLFIIFQAVIQSLKLLYPYRKSALLFHTGGYVALAPSIAAFMLNIPVYIHEQTSRAGLANRISALFAHKIFISFKNSRKYFSAHKTSWIGYPISKFFYSSSKTQRAIEENGQSYLGRVRTKKPLLLITGGGNGSAFINELVIRNLDALTKKYFVLHQVGRAHLDKFMAYSSDSYLAVGLVSPIEWVYLLRKAAVVIARSGAGTVSECIYLNKKVLFIPLEIAQRKEQYYNALEAKQYIRCLIASEKEVRKKSLPELITQLLDIYAKTKYSYQTRSSARKPAASVTYDDFRMKLTTAASKIVHILFADLDNDLPVKKHSAPNRGRKRIQKQSTSNTATAASSRSFKKYSARDSSKPRRQYSSRDDSRRNESYRFAPVSQRTAAPKPAEPTAQHHNTSPKAQPAKLTAKLDNIKYVDNPFRKTLKSPKKKVTKTS